jgi:excisionase family DNA binding protein
MQTETAPILLKMIDAAQRMDISVRLLRRMVKNGEIEVVRYGTRIVRLRPEAIDQWINRNAVPATPLDEIVD